MPDEEKKNEEIRDCDGRCCGGDCGDACVKNQAKGERGAESAFAEAMADDSPLVEMENRWKRALADYRNLQKDIAKEREMMGVYAVARAVERFLPVLDYFRLAMSHKPATLADKNLENWANGVTHIQKQLEDALADLGLTPIKTVGEKFDAAKHEAVGDEAVGGKEHGIIVKEVQSGYELAGKVIRPAKVITAK